MRAKLNNHRASTKKCIAKEEFKSMAPVQVRLC